MAIQSAMIKASLEAESAEEDKHEDFCEFAFCCKRVLLSGDKTSQAILRFSGFSRILLVEAQLRFQSSRAGEKLPDEIQVLAKKLNWIFFSRQLLPRGRERTAEVSGNDGWWKIGANFQPTCHSTIVTPAQKRTHSTSSEVSLSSPEKTTRVEGSLTPLTPPTHLLQSLQMPHLSQLWGGRWGTRGYCGSTFRGVKDYQSGLWSTIKQNDSFHAKN